MKKPAVKGKTGITREMVKDYLTANPEFFTSPDESIRRMLLDMKIPTEDIPNTISLSDFQSRLWRKRAEETEEHKKIIIEDHLYNHKVAIEINKAVLKIMAEGKLQELCLKLEEVFKKDFGVDGYKLALFGKPPSSANYETWNYASLAAGGDEAVA